MLTLPHPPISLLPRIAQNDASAIAHAVEAYGPLVWSLAKGFTRSDAEAEEAVHEIFVQLWRKAEHYKPELGAEVTFISIIARRCLIDRRRRALARARHEQQAGLDKQVSSGHRAEQDGTIKGWDAEGVDEVRRATGALNNLTEDVREVLQLSIAHGRTHEQIAQLKGLPVGTVKTHLRRGLAKIRDHLGLGLSPARSRP